MNLPALFLLLLPVFLVFPPVQFHVLPIPYLLPRSENLRIRLRHPIVHPVCGCVLKSVLIFSGSSVFSRVCTTSQTTPLFRRNENDIHHSHNTRASFRDRVPVKFLKDPIRYCKTTQKILRIPDNLLRSGISLKSF